MLNLLVFAPSPVDILYLVYQSQVIFGFGAHEESMVQLLMDDDVCETAQGRSEMSVVFHIQAIVALLRVLMASVNGQLLDLDGLHSEGFLELVFDALLLDELPHF